VRAATAHSGDTLTFGDEIVLLVTERAPSMPCPDEEDRIALPEMPFGEADKQRILGESPAAWRLRERLAGAAKHHLPVLLLGPSGSGKEAAARAMHDLSPRASGPYVDLNAAAISPGLVESELFGNLKNYPQQGMPARPGLIGQAAGGSLFLDEIGEVPAELQAKLMRVLDAYGTYIPVGGGLPRRPECRWIAATNRDVLALKFDLAARFSKRIPVPSFAERREDIPLLVRKIVLRAPGGGKFVHEVDGRPEVRIARAFLERLVRIDYRTNYRELQLYLDVAIDATKRSEELQAPPDLERMIAHAHGTSGAPAAATDAAPPGPSAKQIKAELRRRRGKIAPTARAFGIERTKFVRLMEKLGLRASPEDDGEP
jgi:two-component system nitrogen regulation response regulator GlnG/two-component system response regulator HydG